MDSPKNDKILGITSKNNHIPFHESNMEIVNQYGQLVGEFSRLDDELWLTSPDHHDSFHLWSTGFQEFHHSSSSSSYQLYQHVDHPPTSECTHKTVSDGVITPVEKNASSLTDSSPNQSQNLSPDSVLRRGLFFVETKPVTRRARSKRQRHHSGRMFSQFRLYETLLIPKKHTTSFVLEETADSFSTKPVRTRKISELLQIPTSDGRKTAQKNLKDGLRNGKPASQQISKRKLPRAEVKTCQHCGSSKTPQWREGPAGRNTLCNACGVQYRNGKLFPEYRPLGSPTYNPSIHSCRPKKVQGIRMSTISEDENQFSQHGCES